jgi:hypothetical protein
MKNWFPIAIAPKDGSYLIVAGPSGYVTTDLRAGICKWDADKEDWLLHNNDRFTDGGEPATQWLPLPYDSALMPRPITERMLQAIENYRKLTHCEPGVLLLGSTEMELYKKHADATCPMPGPFPTRPKNYYARFNGYRVMEVKWPNYLMAASS